MTVLISNPPWWAVDPVRKIILGGVRAGAPRPFLYPVRSAPDQFAYGNYLPRPHRLAEAASALAHTLAGTSSVHLRDSLARRESYETYFRQVQQLRPDLIVVASSPESLDNEIKIVRQLRRNLPRARLILSGSFTAPPSAALDVADTVLTGGQEDALRRALDGERGHIHGHHPEEAQLDDAPLPASDEAAALHYCDPVPHAEFQQAHPVYPHLHIDLSRDAGPGRRCRRPLAAIARQLEDGLRRHPFRGVYFDDSGLATDAEHLAGLCRLMLARRTNWSLLLRPGLPDSNPWLPLRKSGCHGVRFAISSPDDIAPFSADAGHAKALGMTAHASLLRPLPDKAGVLRRLSALHVCNSIQDLVPDTVVVDRIEHRTLVIEPSPEPPSAPCAS